MKIRAVNGKLVAGGPDASIEIDPDAPSVVVTTKKRTITITPEGIQGADGKTWSPAPSRNDTAEDEGNCPSVEVDPDTSAVRVSDGKRTIAITPEGIQGADGKTWRPKP
jgi:hypothetical protein